MPFHNVVLPIISEDYNAFLFKIKQLKKMKHYDPSKFLELLTQWQNVTCQKTCFLNEMCYLMMLSVTKSGNGERGMSIERWWNKTFGGNWSACSLRTKHPIDTPGTTNPNGLAWDCTWASTVRSLHLPTTKLTLVQKGVFYSGNKIYNLLPPYIKSVNNDLNKFKISGECSLGQTIPI